MNKYPVGIPYQEAKGPGKGWWGPPAGTHGTDVSASPTGREVIAKWPNPPFETIGKAGATKLVEEMITQKQFTSQERQSLVDWVALQPQNSSKAIARIEHITSQNGWEVWARQYGGNEQSVAFTLKSSRTMYLGPKALNRGTVTHEWGHAIQNASNAKSKWEEAYKSPEFDRHTRYSERNSREGFAESYLAYMSSGGKATGKFAKTFGVVREVINGL